MINPAFLVSKFAPLIKELEALREHYRGRIMPDHLAPVIREFNRLEKTVKVVEVKHGD